MNRKLMLVFGMMMVISTSNRISFAEQPTPFSNNEGSVYEYSKDEIPDICFFPKDKARWDGSKVAAREWGMFTDFQKVMFISEYVEQLEKEFKASIDLEGGWKYLKAINGFVESCKDECLREPLTEVIRDLLKDEGKIK